MPLRTPSPSLGYSLVVRLQPDGAAPREELLRGLLAVPATISPKYFYDPLGAALFTALCELDEYYPPRTEAAIFAQYRSDIARVLGHGRQLVDLGAGDSAKAQHWFETLRPARYVAVDIAEAGLQAALTRLAAEYDEIDLAGVGAGPVPVPDRSGQPEYQPPSHWGRGGAGADLFRGTRPADRAGT